MNKSLKIKVLELAVDSNKPNYDQEKIKKTFDLFISLLEQPLELSDKPDQQ